MSIKFKFNDYGKAAIKRIREILPSGKMDEGDYIIYSTDTRYSKCEILSIIERDDLVREHQEKYLLRQKESSRIENERIATIGVDAYLKELGYY